jgi:catechol 2,3-dioxygenase-like lactoylglutathione lyase family enzyme
MNIRLNHTIVSARDRDHSAESLSAILGLAVPTIVGPFAIVQIGETSLDFIETSEAISPQHYAFLVNEDEFDAIFQRIKDRGLSYWADPYRRKEGAINSWDGGRGVYWDDPDGHLLEIITRPYGTGGTTTDNPHPLVAEAS